MDNLLLLNYKNLKKNSGRFLALRFACVFGIKALYRKMKISIPHPSAIE